MGLGIGLEAGHHGRWDLRRREQIARCNAMVTLHNAIGAKDVGPSEVSGPTGHVDYRQLSVVGVNPTVHYSGHSFGGRCACLQALEHADSQSWISDVLDGHGAHAGPGMRAARPHADG